MNIASGYGIDWQKISSQLSIAFIMDSNADANGPGNEGNTR